MHFLLSKNTINALNTFRSRPIPSDCCRAIACAIRPACVRLCCAYGGHAFGGGVRRVFSKIVAHVFRCGGSDRHDSCLGCGRIRAYGGILMNSGFKNFKNTKNIDMENLFM